MTERDERDMHIYQALLTDCGPMTQDELKNAWEWAQAFGRHLDEIAARASALTNAISSFDSDSEEFERSVLADLALLEVRA